MLNILTKLDDWCRVKKSWKDRTVGLVPTMGNLHAGHLSLINTSIDQNELTVVTLFVNPTQFNQASDFEQYPRTIQADIENLRHRAVDVVLIPEASELYPDEYQVRVCEKGISDCGEGIHRPGHFDGMLTIVLKLLNIVQPTRAYFGEKDYQQLLLVRKMVQALFLPVEIVSGQTIREKSGLAMSSRNSRLTEAGKVKAAQFSQLLQQNKEASVITDELRQAGFEVDYVFEQWGRRLGAVCLEGIRLIDNIPLITNEV